jgi:predicted transglutaminase-like cysteine proteinase
MNKKIEKILNSIGLYSEQQIKKIEKNFEDNLITNTNHLQFIMDEMKKNYNELLMNKDNIILGLNKELNKFLLPKDTQKLIDFYNDKYPKKPIRYKGYTIHTTKYGSLYPEIDVSDYIHITKSMRDFVKDNNLMFKGEMKPENLSKHAWKVYSFFTKKTRYILDMNLYGENENWLPSMLQMYVKRGDKFVGDCENMANLCASFIIASGVPSGLVRCFTGNTNSGYGHCSLSVWDYRTKGFEQWETTSKTPKQVKEKDGIYIKTVWFSYNDKDSWSTYNQRKYYVIL